MHISGEGRVSIGLTAVLSLGAGASIMWPDHPEVGVAVMAVSAIALVLLGANHLYEQQKTERMIPLIGMTLGATIFIVCAAWYIWPVRPAPAATAARASTDLPSATESSSTSLPSAPRPNAPNSMPGAGIAVFYNAGKMGNLEMNGVKSEGFRTVVTNTGTMADSKLSNIDASANAPAENPALGTHVYIEKMHWDNWGPPKRIGNINVLNEQTIPFGSGKVSDYIRFSVVPPHVIKALHIRVGCKSLIGASVRTRMGDVITSSFEKVGSVTILHVPNANGEYILEVRRADPNERVDIGYDSMN